MSGEVKTRGPGTGATLYFTVMGSGVSVWNTSGGGAFEGYSPTAWTSYAVSLAEQGTTNIYKGDFPSAVPPGVYDLDCRRQLGGSPATTDPTVATGETQWDGSKELSLADLATSGQLAGVGPVRLSQGVALSGFPVYFRSSADHVTPFTSGVYSGQISRNGGAFGPLQSGVFTEIGQGFARVNLTSGDLNALTVALVFTAAGVSGGTADPVPLSFVLQRAG